MFFTQPFWVPPEEPVRVGQWCTRTSCSPETSAAGLVWLFCLPELKKSVSFWLVTSKLEITLGSSLFGPPNKGKVDKCLLGEWNTKKENEANAKREKFKEINEKWENLKKRKPWHRETKIICKMVQCELNCIREWGVQATVALVQNWLKAVRLERT